MIANFTIKKTKLCALSALAVCALLSFSHASSAQETTPFQEAANSFEILMKSENIIGGSLVFSIDGEIIGQCFIGHANLAAKEHVSEETVFHWASITKLFTAVAIMQLVEDGAVHLDDPIVKYVPAFQAVHNPHGDATDVMLRHLLTHSSGLRASTWPWNGDGSASPQSWQPYEPAEWRQIEAMFPYTSLRFEPGENFSYSNIGISLLGAVIESVSGEPYEVYIEDKILRPLNMTHTYFDLPPRRLKRLQSHSYIWDDKNLLSYSGELDTGATVANGGLNGTVSDLLKFANFLSGAGPNEKHDSVLGRETLQSMWRPTFKTYRDEEANERVGLGFFIVEMSDEKGRRRDIVGHLGSQRGYRSLFYIDPETRAAVVMAINTTVKGNARPFVYGMRNVLRNRLFPSARAYQFFAPGDASLETCS